ncbi:MAG: ATP-binding protein [Propionibacteriaceae bacterium]|nr:ATP-binding protein [Propionibacteriaceae bacterium]
MVGRDEPIQAVRRALASGPGDPARAVLVTGPRGSGKTVLLNALEDVALEAGWVVISEIVRPELSKELTETVLPSLLSQHSTETTDNKLTSVSAEVLGVSASVSREVHDRYPVKPSLSTEFEQLAEALQDKDSGLYISLDEVHRSEVGELIPLFHAIQMSFRKGLPVAFVAAGLPSSISSLLNENVLTYLRRAERFVLGDVSDTLVRAAIQEPIVDGGRSISAAALDLAVATVEGYPFLIQVVGFELWQVDPSAPLIDLKAAKTAAARARYTAFRLVHEPAMKDLSDADRRFLQAMAVDEGPASISDIMNRLGATRDHVNKYRSRLIAAQMIEPVGRGLVEFSLPLTRAYLQSEAAA